MTNFSSITAAFDPIRAEAKQFFIDRVYSEIDALRDEEGTIRCFSFRDYSKHSLAARFITWENDHMAPGAAGVVNTKWLDKNAQDFANDQVDSFIVKIEGKIGHLTAVTLELHGNGTFTIQGMHGSEQVCVEQQVVLKTSSKGTFFLQWPARIYVNGTFTPEAKFKELYS
jgi:hypothetical protein